MAATKKAAAAENLTLQEIPMAAEQKAGELTTITQIHASPTPADMLQLAVQRGATMDQLERFMALERQWKADMAREAFNAALAQFKARAIRVKRTTNRQEGPLQGQKYADLNAYVMASAEALGEYGLSASWKFGPETSKEWIEVICVLRHKDGHSEETSFGGGVDTGPGRNAIQARKSSVTYLERITLQAALGLSDENEDDDGAGGGRLEDHDQPTPEQLAIHKDWATRIHATVNDAEARHVWALCNTATQHDKKMHKSLYDITIAHRNALKAKQNAA